VERAHQILREVATARNRGPMVLGVQVQESLYLNHLCGLDPRSWVENGWIDYLIQADFNCTNPQVSGQEFAVFCRGSECTHHVRMGNMMAGGWSGAPMMKGRSTAAYKGNQSYGGMVLSPEEARGAAANIYAFGADGIGLWNICCNMGTRHKAGATGADRGKFQEDMLRWIKAVEHPDNVWAAARTYHFVPIYKRDALPERNYPVNGLLFSPTGAPCQIVRFDAKSLGFRKVYRFLMADGRQGEALSGCMRWRMLASTPKDVFGFDLNGVAMEAVAKISEDDDSLPAVSYEVDLDRCPPFAGENELGMTLRALDDGHGNRQMPYMEELEIVVT